MTADMPHQQKALGSATTTDKEERGARFGEVSSFHRRHSPKETRRKLTITLHSPRKRAGGEIIKCNREFYRLPRRFSDFRSVCRTI